MDEGELREQLDHIRSLSLTRGETTWLRGNTFYGKRQMFRPISWSGSKTCACRPTTWKRDGVNTN